LTTAVWVGEEGEWEGGRERGREGPLLWLFLATVRRRRWTHWGGKEGGKEGGEEGGRESGGEEGRNIPEPGKGGKEGGRDEGREGGRMGEGTTFSRHISTTQWLRMAWSMGHVLRSPYASISR
jgi:hypothetical protein